MLGCDKAGSFPLPHSGTLSIPEFLQELYAKINECVTSVNECITLVENSQNVIENWEKLKAECDMVMLQYANTMAGYEKDVSGYTQMLEELEQRVEDLDNSTMHLETLIEGYKTQVDEKAQEVLSQIGSMADCIVETGSTNGWNWHKYKSGRVSATKGLWIDPQGKVQYKGNGDYYIDYDVEFPFPLAPGRYLWMQPCYSRTMAHIVSSTENFASIRLENKDSSWSDVQSVDVLCYLEGHVNE